MKRLNDSAVGHHRRIDGIEPDLPTALADALNLAGLEEALLQLPPELLVRRGRAVGGLTEKAVMLADHFIKHVACGLEEDVVR
jgi:hypothetical protein